MKFFGAVFIFLVTQLFGSYCYSIRTKVDQNTPVAPLYQTNSYTPLECTLEDDSYLFSSTYAYYGCYKTKKEALNVLQKNNFKFQNATIHYHQQSPTDLYVITPKPTTIQINIKQKLQTLKKEFNPQKLLQQFPKKFYGNSLEIIDLHNIDFLPFINLYSLQKEYTKVHKKPKVLILYDGVYTLEMIYKQLHNDNYIEKVDPKTYIIKIPLVIAPTATLVIKNKNIYLQSYPKAIFIFYYGNFYLYNNHIVAWDTQHNCYFKRKYIPKEKALYFNYENQRAYITGLAGSHTYFLQNSFQGLGFHSISATFGLSLLSSPDENKYFSTNKPFNYFLSINNYPTGYYVGNDIFDGNMAFYTNKAKNVTYLGNYTHHNHIYNFDPHDYSKGLNIAYNLSAKAQLAHGIIISRGVENTFIANNISIDNHSAGIMIDRTSNHNIIANNLTLANGFMGISIQESDDILIKNNTIAFNHINGIMSRNSNKISITKNIITSNGKNGVEITSKNIDDTPSRDFFRDPYHKISSAVVTQNTIKENLHSEILVKNSAAVLLKDNTIDGIKNFAGDLDFFSEKILKNNNNFLLYGRGYPYKSKGSDNVKLTTQSFNIARSIYIELANIHNKEFATNLGILYLKNNQIQQAKKELLIASSQLFKGALGYLGYLYLTDCRLNGYTNKEKLLEALTLIIEDTILQNPSNSELKKLIYFIPHGKYYLLKAFQKAKKRLQNGKVFANYMYKNSFICKYSLSKENKQKAITAINIFLYKMKLNNTNNFLTYLEKLYKNFTNFTPRKVYVLQQRLDQHNKLQDEVLYHDTQQHLQLLQNKACFEKQQQNIYFKKQTDSLLKELSMQQFQNYLPQIQKYLDDINYFRKEKISIETIKHIIKTQGVLHE